MRLVLILSGLQISTLAVLEGLGIDLASSQMHLLDYVLLKHEGVDLALEVVVSLVRCAFQDLHCQLRQQILTI